MNAAREVSKIVNVLFPNCHTCVTMDYRRFEHGDCEEILTVVIHGGGLDFCRCFTPAQALVWAHSLCRQITVNVVNKAEAIANGTLNQ